MILPKLTSRKHLGLALLAAIGLASFAFLSPYQIGKWRKLSSTEPSRAFYFWKTQWQGSPKLLEGIAANKVTKLYMRFFDVTWDIYTEGAMPVAPLQFNSQLPKNVEIVPVVYLTNSVFLHIPYEKVEDLSEKVWRKVSRMAEEQKVAIHQLQLDCDWSEKSKRSYFHFVDLLSRKLAAQKIATSSTLRLHQIKYFEHTGIPPVSRGMLMFYNFGRIQADTNRSSIFNQQDAKKYTSYIASYPMDLDIVLPLFSWIVHSRDGKVLELIEKTDPKEFEQSDAFEKVAENRIRAKRNLFFRGKYFVAGDLLLIEETSPEMTKQAAELAMAGASWKKQFTTVALFDLDERNLSRYEKSDLVKIVGKF